MDKSTAYKMLGLQEGATEDEIKNAYRHLAQQYGSDNDGQTSPLQPDGQQKMDEINQAFDTLMSYMRTGGAAAPDAAGSTHEPHRSSNDNIGRYPAIRKLINTGQADEALAELSAIPYGSSDAEWNFLMGSAYYYKGWLDKALQYFQTACQLEPGNREYEAALRNLTGAANGTMPGNPYTPQDPNSAAIDCACNTCALTCCLRACCGRGI